jgi:hypothetical protein
VRLKYGALKEDEAQRLKALEQENARLKRNVAEQFLDISMLKDVKSGTLVIPSQRRAAIAFLMKKRRVSERRACQVVGLHRATNRYVPIPGDFEARLIEAIKEFADRFSEVWVSTCSCAVSGRRLVGEREQG